MDCLKKCCPLLAGTYTQCSCELNAKRWHEVAHLLVPFTTHQDALLSIIIFNSCIYLVQGGGATAAAAMDLSNQSVVCCLHSVFLDWKSPLFLTDSMKGCNWKCLSTWSLLTLVENIEKRTLAPHKKLLHYPASLFFGSIWQAVYTHTECPIYEEHLDVLSKVGNSQFILRSWGEKASTTSG